MIRLFAGYDPREARGFYAFHSSLVAQKERVALVTLTGEQADGTNLFTYERFRIPEYCNWGGMAIFVDGSDMLLRAPISALAALYDPTKAVQVVKHDYRTKHARKYVGTEMESGNEDYPRKNWSSVVIWNCGHMAHFRSREQLRGYDGKFLHRFGWLKDEEIGELPKEWNWLPQEFGENEKAKLLHYTIGIPGFRHYSGDSMSSHWHEAAKTWDVSLDSK